MEELHCLITTSSLRISYDTTNQWLYNQWLGLHDTESVRLSAEAIFSCLATHPCTKMLSDHSLLHGNWQPAIPSVVQQNFERLATHGVVYFAWVCGLTGDDLIAMEQVVRHTSRPVVGLFDDVASAYDWLSSRRVAALVSPSESLRSAH